MEQDNRYLMKVMKMQIVIEIPEKTINHIRSDYGHGIYIMRGADKKIICEAIVNGTPLPKGHGELIDVSKLIGKIHGTRSICAVLDAPTIIEADKEKE